MLIKLTTGLMNRPSRCCYAPQHIYITGLSSALSARILRSGMDCREKRTVTFFRTSLFSAYLWDTAAAIKYPREKQTLGTCAAVTVAKRLCFSRVAPVPADSLNTVGYYSPTNEPYLLERVQCFSIMAQRHISPQEVLLWIKTTMAIFMVISLHQHTYSFKGDVLIIKNRYGESLKSAAETRWFPPRYFRVVLNLDSLRLHFFKS